MTRKQGFAISIVAVIAIACLEVVAMTQGQDGYLLSLAVAAIAAIAGVSLPFRAKEKK